ncbi:hypothetical protein MHU86_20058 [Fragilaria crotonensis]|nr:hypothetical protein MHU86_20058 [Fragilaria crotonensis]
MVRFNPLLCLVAAPSAVVAFQAPLNKARVYRPNEAVAIGTESFTQTPEKSSNDAGSMIDLTGVVFSGLNGKARGEQRTSQCNPNSQCHS